MRPFGKTRAAAGYAARHAGAEVTRTRAAGLLRELTAYETALADGDGRQPAAVSAALLRSVVISVRDLAGAGWLEAMADDPDVAAFAAMQATASPPDPARIDETCSRVLWARFASAGVGREGTA